MTSREYATGRNILIALGLWWCFTFLGSIFLWVWGIVFVDNRVFSGSSGNVLREALTLPAYIVVGVLVGLGAVRFIESSRPLVWSAALAVLIALADMGSWGGMKYRGRSSAEAGLTAVVIVASILGGCWVGARMKSERLARGQVA